MFVPSVSSEDAVYHGGRILSKINVFAIFWNQQVENMVGIDGWYKAVLPSNFLSLASEYNEGVHNIQPGIYRGFMVHGGSRGGIISWSELQNTLVGIIKEKVYVDPMFPLPSGDTVYVFHIPSNVKIQGFDGLSCDYSGAPTFAGFHSAFIAPHWMSQSILNPDRNILYAVIATCNPKWPAAQYSVLSHEIVESVTNPESWPDLKKDGWLVNNKEEIADVCQTRPNDMYQITGLDGKNWIVQKFWSNLHQDCIPNDNVSVPEMRYATAISMCGNDYCDKYESCYTCSQDCCPPTNETSEEPTILTNEAAMMPPKMDTLLAVCIVLSVILVVTMIAFGIVVMRFLTSQNLRTT